MVRPSPGCGEPAAQALGQWVRHGIKIPNPPRGTGDRVYFVRLPSGYDPARPYRLLFEGPPCGGRSGDQVYQFQNQAGTEGLVQVALIPEPGVWMGCFDDKRTNSIEYGYFETVLEKVRSGFCFDEHRVFMTGNSSGSWRWRFGR